MACLRRQSLLSVGHQASFLLLKTRKGSFNGASSQFTKLLEDRLEEIRDAGTWKEERIILSKQGSEINVKGSPNNILNFCANNYLGLSSHPEVIQAGKEALDRYGAGLSSVRFICGTQDIHKELERKIAEFHGREDAILYPSCFDANAGLFESILEPVDAVFSDELNHASIIDGVRLCKAKKLRYKHKDMNDLERVLKENEEARVKLVITDGVFSMDGNVAPLREIAFLADKYGALIFIDECHATGFFGETGRGTEEFFSLTGRVDIINSTLGKALGGAAGRNMDEIRWIHDRLQATGFLTTSEVPSVSFSNTLPPPVVGAASKVFDLLMDGTYLTSKVAENTRLFRNGMTEAGFTIAGEDHPLCPVMLGDERLAVEFADEMLKRDIYVIGFTYPVVPVGKSRIRVQISASHSTEEIERCIEAFIEVGRTKGVIS